MKNIIADVGLDPRRLELEITESDFVGPARGSISSAFTIFDTFGVSVAMDDFGTGYSSLAVLRDIQFDTIKLDKSFHARPYVGPGESNACQIRR